VGSSAIATNILLVIFSRDGVLCSTLFATLCSSQSSFRNGKSDASRLLCHTRGFLRNPVFCINVGTLFISAPLLLPFNDRNGILACFFLPFQLITTMVLLLGTNWKQPRRRDGSLVTPLEQDACANH
jgi:hypothetical protein